DQPLIMEKGNLAGHEVKAINLRNGSIEVQPGSGAFTIAPLPGKDVELSGELFGFKVENLKSSGNINFDPYKQAVTWDKEASVHYQKWASRIWQLRGRFLS